MCVNTCSEEEVNGAIEEDQGNSLSLTNDKHHLNNFNKINLVFFRHWLEYSLFIGLEVNTMRIVDHESDNNGLTSDSLIRLTSEEEDSGVFR